MPHVVANTTLRQKDHEYPMPLQLYLIRHGQTKWSLTGQHTGRTDLPLTVQGEQEARDLALHLKNVRFNHVLISPLQRAGQTCKLARLYQSAKVNPDLVEWDYGDYEGQQSVAILKSRPNWSLFRDGCPNGEMPEQVSDRADRLIAELRKLDGHVALFSHGHFSSALAVRWIGLPLAEAEHLELGTASISILGHNPHHLHIATIRQWNAATLHLSVLPQSQEIPEIRN